MITPQDIPSYGGNGRENDDDEVRMVGGRRIERKNMFCPVHMILQCC